MSTQRYSLTPHPIETILTRLMALKIKQWFEVL